MCWGWDYTLEFIYFSIVLGLEIWGGNKLVDHVYDKYKEKGTETATPVVTEFRTVKAFDQELNEANHFKNDLKDEEKIMVKASFVRRFSKMIAICVLVAMCLIFTCYLIIELYRDKVEMYVMSDIIKGVCFTAAGILSALSISDISRKARNAARHVCAIIEIKPSVGIYDGRIRDNTNGGIEFCVVSFKYQS